MTNRLSDAMNKLTVESSRNSFARTSAASAAKRQSGLDPSTINAMFPDAAAAIATEKAKFTQQTGNPPASNRNSAAVDVRNSLVSAPITAHQDSGVANQVPLSPWPSTEQGVPKSAKSQTPMGQFGQPNTPGSLRSPLPQMVANSAIQNTTLNAPDKSANDLPLLSPYNGTSGNWASMVNTPMNATFNAPTSGASQADMVANATAMKLAALSTVNTRFALDDVRKYRRTRSNDPHGTVTAHGQVLPTANVVMVNEHGQVLNMDQVASFQQNQSFASRSRPNSPGIAVQQAVGPLPPFAPQQHGGFLSAYDGSPVIMNTGAIGMGQLGIAGHEGYLSDHSDIARGRSPRGRRGSSKPPEDPTDPSLLQDIPSWLRSLRLHKYTDNLKDMRWTELVELDDKALEDRGVNALGARRKMLKVFEQVKGNIHFLSLAVPDTDANFYCRSESRGTIGLVSSIHSLTSNVEAPTLAATYTIIC